MREIKFRAWIHEQERMVNVIGFDFGGNNSTVQWYDTTHDALSGRISDAFMNRTEVMQYTGLKDKNGREIYEGDITRNKHGSIGIIKFHKSWGAFYFDTVLGYNEEGNLVKIISSVPMWNDWNTLEIIGNIYENPELLKEGETA